MGGSVFWTAERRKLRVAETDTAGTSEYTSSLAGLAKKPPAVLEKLTPNVPLCAKTASQAKAAGERTLAFSTPHSELAYESGVWKRIPHHLGRSEWRSPSLVSGRASLSSGFPRGDSACGSLAYTSLIPKLRSETLPQHGD